MTRSECFARLHEAMLSLEAEQFELGLDQLYALHYDLENAVIYDQRSLVAEEHGSFRVNQ